MLEAYQAQAALIKVEKEFPAGAGWEIKSEYTVSDGFYTLKGNGSDIKINLKSSYFAAKVKELLG